MINFGKSGGSGSGGSGSGSDGGGSGSGWKIGASTSLVVPASRNGNKGPQYCFWRQKVAKNLTFCNDVENEN